ncbi:hypothetical protein ACWCQW_05665 [Streptomyces mirabilis]
MEEPELSVVLTGTGDRRMDVVQAVRSITGLSAWRSARLLESIPVVVSVI